ncbi:general stress protein [Lentibacillus sediminis]|uniref:general stress protein n=1 Tax=Lentibacillus sediminis TaxID=1940529 RepID=UPI000C1C7517|nr:general stress protein [Lentibacillus sediminis]
MKPFIKEYTNDEQLKTDVSVLKDKGVNKDDVYILSHDDDRTERVADSAGANTIGFNEMDFSDAVGTMFSKKGDELRTKLEEIGFTEAEAENYEEKMDEGKVFLIVTNNADVNSYLM